MGALSSPAYADATSVQSAIRTLSNPRAPRLGQPRLIVSEPVRQWRDGVKSRLDEVCSLPSGWNGYGAPPVSFQTADFALRMLETICATSAPAPQIVPGANGDLQLEWHLTGGDLELHVRAPYDVYAWRGSDRLDDDGETVNLTNDFTVLRAWIGDLVESTRAVEAAAA